MNNTNKYLYLIGTDWYISNLKWILLKAYLEQTYPHLCNSCVCVITKIEKVVK